MSPTPPGRTGFEFTFSKPGADSSPSPRPTPDTPFRIALLADLSGRASRGIVDAASPATLPIRRAHRIDIDNLDDTIAAMNVVVRINTPDAPSALDIPITTLDDFHPDHLYRTLDLFAPLRDLRARLLDPSTFPAAAEEARATLNLETNPASPQTQTPAPSNQPPATDAGSLLESLLGGRMKPSASQPAAATSAPTSKGTDVASIVRRMAQAGATDAVAAADPQQSNLLAALDREISARMRTVLHNPAFQRIESAWRAVHFLITSIQTAEDLTIDLFDVSKPELTADLHRAAAAANLQTSGLAKLILDRSINAPAGEPWSLIIADLTLDFTTADAALAAYLAAVASRAGAPIVAAASPAHVGCPSFALAPDSDTWNLHAPAGDDAAPAAWGAVRQIPEAAYLALALPRFLVRLPYGPGGEAVESFAFREIASPATDHESYLWANAAHAAAVVIAQAFTDDGADIVLPGAGEITGLPVHIYVSADKEKLATPCAEAWLTLKASHHIQTAGLTPLLSIKGRDAARLATIQSIADPIAPLAGRWSQ